MQALPPPAAQLASTDTGSFVYAEYCRRLFKRAINAVFEDASTEAVCKDWLAFEQSHGSPADIIAATSKCFTTLKQSLLQAHVQQQQLSVPMETSLAAAEASGDSDRKRKRGEATEEQDVAATDSKRTKVAGTATKVAEESVDAAQVASAPVAQVRNMPFTTTAEEVQQHIETLLSADCGADCVRSVTLVLSKAGTSRGIAHVTFSSAHVLHKAVLTLNQKTQIGGRLIILEELQPQEAAAHKAVKQSPADCGSEAAPHLSTVFVSRLPPALTSEELQQHFSSCGEVLSARVAKDKKTGESKVRVSVILFCVR